jgi:MFS family permease
VTRPIDPASRFRWVVLGAATFAQMSFSAFTLGLPALTPAVRSEYDASLGGTGVFLGVVSLGLAATLLPWGLVSDRIGERAVMSIGLLGASCSLALGAYAPTFAVFAAALCLAAALGACVNSAIGRAVLAWFRPEQRGLAYSIRQAGMMVAAALAAATLPSVASAHGLSTAVLILAAGCLAGSIVSVVVLRSDHRRPEVGSGRLTAALLDHRLLRLSLGSSFACVAQSSVTGFIVLFLHDVRDLSAASAAVALALSQVLGAALRIGTGIWSDRVHSRVMPLRAICLAIAATLGVAAALENAPLAILIPAFVLAGGISMSWNTVSFAAAVELGGASRGGATVGFQQAVLGLVAGATPFAFAYCVEATSWTLGWTLAALLPLAGWYVLRGLPVSRAYRGRAAPQLRAD